MVFYAGGGMRAHPFTGSRFVSQRASQAYSLVVRDCSLRGVSSALLHGCYRVFTRGIGEIRTKPALQRLAKHQIMS